MLKVSIITLFPDFFKSPFESSLLGRALANKILHVDLVNLRDFAINKYGQVDDAPYGGGPGMVLMVEPVKKALDSIPGPRYVILLSPRGHRLKQADINNLAKIDGDKTLVFICGHYEGIDERIVHYVDTSFSLGEFVISGGEPAALVMVDAISRQLDGFVEKRESIEKESYMNDRYIEYPHYTRPREFEGLKVPDVLLSGNHKKIEEYREKEIKAATARFLKNDQKEDSL